MSKHGNFKETFQEQTVDIENLEKQKKISLEPDLNQWPKDICILSSTVLRSTNWAIEGLL